MIQLGVFEIAYEDANHLRVTPFGMKILKGAAHIELSTHVPPQYNAKGRKGEKAVPEETNADPAYTSSWNSSRPCAPTYLARKVNRIHRIQRRHTARHGHAPPDHPRRVPAGQRRRREKAATYGKRFLSAIRKFEGLGAGTPAGTSLKETLILFNTGMGVGEIAATKHVSTDTIYNHLAQLIEQGLITTFGTIISRKEYEDIVNELKSRPA